MNTLHHVIITPSTISLDNLPVAIDACGGEMLSQVYRTKIGGYAKFFKMDSLSKLGFLAAEFLLRDIPPEQKENAAVVLFNRSGSLVTDRNYQRTITLNDNYFPSPALFVYTLANIVTGEIAIRHKIYGETAFYILPERDDATIERVVADMLLTSSPTMVVAGWVDWLDENNYIADLKLITN